MNKKMPRIISGHFTFIIFKPVIDFSKIPFVRLLIPFIGGLLISKTFNFHFNPLLLLLSAFIIMAVLFAASRKWQESEMKYYFLLSSDIFLMIAAFYASYISDYKNQSAYYGYYASPAEVQWRGIINELPVEKENYFKVTVRINAVNGKEAVGPLMVYFKKPVSKQLLQPGNEIESSTVISGVPPPQNPHEFDYKAYLENKGISYQTFVNDPLSLKVTTAENNLKYFGLRLKSRIVDFFNSGVLAPVSGQLCSALLTGYDNEMSRDTINAFARSGTLHVLSVSGLHTGVLFSVVLFLLNYLDRYNRFKWLKLIVLLFSLWFFVLIAGFTPPVLRAAFMLSLFAIGKYHYNYISNASINSMAVSAFVLLLIDPNALNDVGFLLSYLALLGIFIFEPSLSSLYKGDNKIASKLWQLASVSIAAQIATLPVTLYYFHQFPVWFVFSNLLIIPLCTLVMMLALLLVFKWAWISFLINTLTSFIFKLAELTNHQGWGYWDGIDFNGQDVVFLTTVIVGIYLFIQAKEFNLILTSCLIIIAWQVFNLVEVIDKKQKSSWIVYQSKKSSFVDFKNRNKVWMDSTGSANDYDFHVKNNHTNYNYPAITGLKYNYISASGSSLLIVKTERHIPLIALLNPDYVLFQNNVVPDRRQLNLGSLKQIITDGTSSYKSIKSIKNLGLETNISVHNTRESGFLELPL